MLTKNLYLALMIILFSIVSYLISLPYPDKSAYFPRFLIVLLAIWGVLILVKEIQKNIKAGASKPQTHAEAGDHIPFFRQPAYRKVALMTVASMVYLLVINWVGFFSTALVYIPVMIWALGVRKIRTIIASTLVVVFFIYLIFSVFLRVPFPEGLLF